VHHREWRASRLLLRESYKRKINGSLRDITCTFLESFSSKLSMRLEIVPARSLAPKKTFARHFARFAVLVLLFSVAGLSTRAKTSLYHSNHTSTHYLSIASKMKASQSSAALEQPAARVVPSRSLLEFPDLCVVIADADCPGPLPTGLFLSLQLRSPPLHNSLS
jgi:hypothetical protein